MPAPDAAIQDIVFDDVKELLKPEKDEAAPSTNITAGFMKANTDSRLYSHSGRADFVKTGTREDFT
jgi:hypothetical protein